MIQRRKNMPETLTGYGGVMTCVATYRLTAQSY